MQHKHFDKLNFLTAGMPHRTGDKGYARAFELLKEFDLDGMELEFVYGVRMSEATQKLVKETASRQNMVLSAHGPYYINLNAKEQEKIDASIIRILETARMAQNVDAFSITYHAAFYLGADKETVFKQVEKNTAIICETLEKEGIKVWIRPETTGKKSQWGDLDEIIKLSKNFKQVLPCIDFSHLHARENGKFNTYDEFSLILEKIGTEIGAYALENFHGHMAGIAYGVKGEKNHLIFDESDMNYKDVIRALKNFGVKGALVCESPNIEDDAMLLKHYYQEL